MCEDAEAVRNLTCSKSQKASMVETLSMGKRETE